MLNFITTFMTDEDGAVTVDWVVLTAAVVGMGIVVLSTVKTGSETMATSIETQLGTTAPAVAF